MEFSGLLKCILGTDRAGKAKAYVRGNPSTEIACDVRHLIAANDTANTDKRERMSSSARGLSSMRGPCHLTSTGFIKYLLVRLIGFNWARKISLSMSQSL